MFQSLVQGFTAVALMLTQFVTPIDDGLRLSLAGLEQHGAAVVVKMKLDLPLDKKLEELIDAGMPLSVIFETISQEGVQRRMVRTLRFRTESFNYVFTDSTEAGVQKSKEYPMILLALRDYCSYETVVPARVPVVKVRSALLPGRLNHIKRIVDPRMLLGKHQDELEVDLKGGKR